MANDNPRQVITEREILEAAPGATISVDENAIITPLAWDIASERGARIERLPRPIRSSRIRIAVGADHGGFEAKERLKSTLVALGHEFQDFGTYSPEPVDYPDFAHMVALAVANGSCQLGIMVDGAGIGSCIVANKVPGIRAALCYDEATARNSREHNGANVLTLGGKMLSADQLEAIVTAWLSSELTEDRHRRRVEKIRAVEHEHLKEPCRTIKD
jgi:ribose 5-phosphate isomerase B